MVNVTDPDANRAVAGVLSFVVGGTAEKYRNVVIVYETTDDTIGALSFTCCTEHALKVLALGSVVIIDDPAAPLGQDCTG